MKKIKSAVVILFLILVSFNAHSANDYLIYVSNFFDKHPTHIVVSPRWQWGYWVNQATILKNSSKAVFTSSANCEKDQYGKLILSLEPKIFYNPGMTILYGDITAKIYGYDGKIITSINIEDQAQGVVTVLYEKLVDKLYKKILIQLQNQISANESINLYLQKNSEPIEGTFCSIFN